MKPRPQDFLKPETPNFSTFAEFRTAYRKVCQAVAKGLGDTRSEFYINGSGPVSSEHLQHRVSWDVDLAGKHLDTDLSTAVSRLRKAFGKRVRFTGDGLDQEGIVHGILSLPDLPAINIDLLGCIRHVTPSPEWQGALDSRGYDVVYPPELGMGCVSLEQYAQRKVNSLFDRREPKDIYDLAAVFAVPHMRDSIYKRATRNLTNKDLRHALASIKGGELDAYRPAGEGFNPPDKAAVLSLAASFENIQRVREARERILREEREAERDMRGLGVLSFGR